MNINVQFLNGLVKKKVIKLFKFLKVLAQSKIDFICCPEKLDLLLYDFDGNRIALKIFKSKKYGIFIQGKRDLTYQY